MAKIGVKCKAKKTKRIAGNLIGYALSNQQNGDSYSHNREILVPDLALTRSGTFYRVAKHSVKRPPASNYKQYIIRSKSILRRIKNVKKLYF
jgi:hypothetical protein